MEQRKVIFIALAAILIVSFVSRTNAKKASNQTSTDDCYKPCRVKSSPVCGNDGRNYTTGCHLSVARCRARKIGQRIFVVNTGYCRSSKPVSQCFLNCTDRREPVCASDRKTYKNLCLFKKAKCEKRKNKEPPITVVSRRGPCVKKASSCRTFASCPKVRKPVCGSDNVSYKNICHLKTTNCRKKARNARNAKGKKYTKIVLKHWGACGQAKQCTPRKCTDVKFCDQLLRAAVRYAEVKESKSDGKVAPRSSKKKANKKKKSSSKKQSAKKPSPKKNNARKKTNPKGKTGETSRTGKKSAKKVGPKKIYQVCGSDGNTYRSICHLQVAQCNKMSKCGRLLMKHKGACKKRRAGKT